MNPFIKWQGGKVRLLNILAENLPKNLNEFEYYIEPFLGAGSLFIYCLENKLFKKYIVNDINHRLIITYKVIRDNVYGLIENLKYMQNLYSNATTDKKEKMYYFVRKKFNSDKISDLRIATYFIFLNKSCFNGLYRENLKDEHNTPYGHKDKINIVQQDNLVALSKSFNENNIVFENKHFSEINIPKNSFIYADPPYKPATKEGYTKYNKNVFNDKQQIDLANILKINSKNGNKFIFSNHKTECGFFEDLYSGYNINYLSVGRYMSGKIEARGKTNELLIKNY